LNASAKSGEKEGLWRSDSPGNRKGGCQLSDGDYRDRPTHPCNAIELTVGQSDIPMTTSPIIARI